MRHAINDLNKRDLNHQMPSKDSLNVTSKDMNGMEFKLQQVNLKNTAAQMVKQKSIRKI